MLQDRNSMFDTPVRRDSITITSLRSRTLISNNTQNTAKKKILKMEEERRIMSDMNYSSVVEKLAPFTNNKEEENDISMVDCGDFVMKMDEKDENAATPQAISNDYRSNDGRMEGRCTFQEQKHSTPRILKLPTRAVSSTPNHELLNDSKITRNVSTQTNFTLSGRDFEELDSNLKAYCIEIPNERSLPDMRFKHKKNTFDVETDSSSPLRNLCTSKLKHYEITPIQSKASALRKLSLRSKTMICSAFEKTKERPNILIKYKSAEETLLFSNTFSLLPHPNTPSSNPVKVVHNPFEDDLPDRLGKTMFSPNVFDNVLSPSEDSVNLRWTIEDISSINPVPIEEDFTIPSDDEDPEKESYVQQEIDRYFSETHLILSPFDVPKPTCSSEKKEITFHKRATASTPQKYLHSAESSRKLENSKTQTTLSLPENLPGDLEENLRSYFKLFESDEFNLSASNLRRKLFFHSEDEPPSPVRFETCLSPVTNGLLKIEHSPYDITKNQRHFTPVGHQQQLSSPELSPVAPESTNVGSKNYSISTCKKTLHLCFPGDSLEGKGVQDAAFTGPVVNSTVIVNSAEGPTNMSLDCSSMVSSALPSSLDTGYHTEDSWQQSTKLVNTSNKPLNLPSSMMASTPTHLAK